MVKNRTEIITDLKEMSDQKYKEFHNKICPNSDNNIGVRLPVLRKYAKQLSDSESWNQNYKCLRNEFYEETMLKGMVIGLAKIDIETRLEYLEDFIPQIDNWAVCDTACAGLKFINKNKEEMWDFIQKYLFSKKEFELRFAIVTILDYYIEDEYLDKIITLIEKINCDQYYVMMAVAWLVSVIYAKYPEFGMNYLKNSKLDKETYNIAIQKILDSYRVDSKSKDKIRKMKKDKKQGGNIYGME